MKNKLKKNALWGLIPILCLIAAYYFLVFAPHQKAVDSFNNIAQKVKKQNNILEDKIKTANQLLSNKDKPLDENLSSELKNEITSAEKAKRKISKIKKSTSDINKQVEALKKPLDYTTEIKKLDDLNQKYSTSVKQLKQITNPSSSFIESRLKEIDTITGVQSATEDNDPNKGLNKQGSYTASVYFTDSLVTDTIEGKDIVTKGTDAGGNIEVYKTVEDAQKRNEYLSAFDGLPAMLNPGSHYVYGTIIIRTSGRLTATQQNDLTQKIYQKLIEIKDGDTSETSQKTETNNSSETSTQTNVTTQSTQKNSGTVSSSTTENTTNTASSEKQSEYLSNIDANGYNKLTGENIFEKKSGNPEDGPEYHSFFDRNGYNSQTGMNLNDYVVPNDSSTGIGWSDGQ
ncbi:MULTISPECIES: hypothetical protein [Streptococcus]|uniref:EbhA n=1 Tax=Streptococcus salivarius TaxID=1304 RepID=A0A074IXX3_STRSL|nr:MULTISPECIES: hypothetical protein [Streptococcus]KEO44960.1 hypothetical protein DL07_03575 [Streptococcus salivarius]KEO46574.1 hypothetical protein DL08_00195 [Streptococcus salivarius]MBK5025916.1 hypothetical protein [Streptococcus sp. 17.1]MBK5141999.1 hypothetical protein [Streptococcus sp. 16.1]MBT9615520.1 hypothetical protein [Streptococcus salivarius]